MRTKHTPGPWQIVEGGGAGLTTMIYPIEGGGGCIATLDAQLDSALTEPANACLIAAAPEMLEALTCLGCEITIAGLGFGDPKIAAAMDKAMRAIKKAKGEA